MFISLPIVDYSVSKICLVYDLANSGHLGYHLLIFKAQGMVYVEYIQSFSIQQAVESNFVLYAATCYVLI